MVTKLQRRDETMIWQTSAPPPGGAASRPPGRPVKALLLIASLLVLPAPVIGEGSASVEELVAAGRTALGRGDAAAAVSAFAEAARLAPADAEVFYHLGSAHESLGEKEPAVKAFRRAFELDPDHLPARRALVRLGAVGWSESEILERAELLSLEGRVKEAAYLFQRYLKEQPDSARAVLGLARCRERLGEADAARELYSRALDLDPSLEEARAKLEPAAATAPPPPVEPQTPPAEPPAVEPPAPAETRPSISEAPPAPPPEVADVETSTVAATGADSTPDGAAATAADSTEPDGAAEPAALPPPVRETESPAEAAAGPGPRRPPLMTLALAAPAAAFVLFWLRRRRKCSIRGRLENFPLPDALQLLAAGRKEGVLEIAAGGAGWIWLQRGRIVAAELGSKTGAGALFALLSAAAGTFAFFDKPLAEELPRSLDLSVQEALLQWAGSIDHDNREPSPDGDAEAALSLEEIGDEALNIELPF